jgi:hypothetical protein
MSYKLTSVAIRTKPKPPKLSASTAAHSIDCSRSLRSHSVTDPYKDQFCDFYLRTFPECWDSYKPIFIELGSKVDFDEIGIRLMSERTKAWEPLKILSETPIEISKMEAVRRATVSFHARHKQALEELLNSLSVFSTQIKADPQARLAHRSWKTNPLGQKVSAVKEFYRVELPESFRTAIDVMQFGETAEQVKEAVASLSKHLNDEIGRRHENFVFSYQLRGEDYINPTRVKVVNESYLRMSFEIESREVSRQGHPDSVKINGPDQWKLLRSLFEVAPGGKTVVDLEDEGFKQNTIYKIKDNLNRRISNLSIEVDASGVWKLVPI